MHRVVIVGGGFAGLAAARALRKVSVDITLIDQHNYHLFQPLLYQVATGGLSPANIAAPLRNILKRQRNCRVLLGKATAVSAQEVILESGTTVPFDSLIVATGSRQSYFGHEEWSTRAPGLKSIDDATALRRKILLAFEIAEQLSDVEEVSDRLTFVIVGAGPTGVELAGAIAEIAHQTLRNEFRRIDPATARVILLDFAARVLPTYANDLSAAARRGLEELGVEVQTERQVVQIDDQGVHVRHLGAVTTIRSQNIFWAAGVQGSEFGAALAQAFALPLDRSGRLAVAADFSLPGHPAVFIVGDLALYAPSNASTPLPALAPVALQAGTYVAQVIRARLTQRSAPAPFRYHDYGVMATIGRRQAVADIHGWHFRGTFAWYIWLFVHLIQLVAYESRVLVLIQWSWHYFTRNRSARLITGDSQRP